MTTEDTPPAAGGQAAAAGRKRRRHRKGPSARRMKKLRQAAALDKDRERPRPGEVTGAKRLDKDWLPPILSPRYAAIDLGTNNCRLLVAAPAKDGFRVVDAFSRIVRLGEGLAANGSLSEAAMDRTIEALKICREKIDARRVTSLRCIATQACRGAENGESFLKRIEAETGLVFDLISTEEEADLSVRGCLDLMDPQAAAALVFDIGGGSTELSWVERISAPGEKLRHRIAAWTSLPYGVVTLSERFGGRDLTRERYEEMVATIAEALRPFAGAGEIRPHFANGEAHLLGTSGTVTSLAGVHLGLKRYNRRDVDGIWLASERALDLSEKLRAMSFEVRSREPCIGVDRADLVVPGCAILEGILEIWPSHRIRVADRGLREGILTGLIEEDRKRRRRRRRK